jgi:hypothetical protein
LTVYIAIKPEFVVIILIDLIVNECLFGLMNFELGDEMGKV